MFLFALVLSCLFTLITLHLIISLCNVSALKVADAFVKRKMCNTLLIFPLVPGTVMESEKETNKLTLWKKCFLSVCMLEIRVGACSFMRGCRKCNMNNFLLPHPSFSFHFLLSSPHLDPDLLHHLSISSGEEQGQRQTLPPAL